MLAKLEKGLRQNITVAELLLIARALHVPPIVLLFPIEEAEAFEVLPGTEADAWLAMRWFTGESPFPSPRDDATATVEEQATWRSWHRDPTGLLSYRRHERCLIAWTRFRAHVQTALNDASAPGNPEEARQAHMARARDADHAAFTCEQTLCQERLGLRAQGMRLPQLPVELDYLDAMELPEEFLSLSINAAHRIEDPKGNDPSAAPAEYQPTREDDS